MFDPAARSEPPLIARNEAARALILFGPSDHVIYPEFDRMAAVVFPDHVGPFLLRTAATSCPGRPPTPSASGPSSLCSDLLGSG